MAQAQETEGRCFGQAATIMGTLGSDHILGTEGDDVIQALAGDDTVEGRGGNDLICGGGGEDRIHGGDGDDSLAGRSKRRSPRGPVQRGLCRWRRPQARRHLRYRD